VTGTGVENLNDENVSRFDTDGFIVARQFFAPANVAEIRDTFMALTKDGPVPGLSEVREEYAAGDPLSRWPRVMHPHRRVDLPAGHVSRKYMLHPRLRPTLARLMRDEPLAVQSMFYFKPPGSRGQALHQDNYYLRVRPGTCVAAWVAIDDADEENGGMLCVPGTANLDVRCPKQSDSTRSFTGEHVEPPAGRSAQLVPLKSGDVLFFNGSVIHGSEPNRSATRFRRSFICHYVPAGSIALARWYADPLDFDGEVRSIAPATGGGPCGTVSAESGAAP
jgi:ectoine hydroxylase-related dioxygenase (phytanoyl-CoA dioxygenase family)